MARELGIRLTPKQAVWAPTGCTIGSIDFKSQELMIAASWSGDPIMRDAFTQPEMITIPGTDEQAPNPRADLHTMTTKECCFPDIFRDAKGKELPEWEWVKTAKDESKIAKIGDPRKYGKITNFGILFGQRGPSISEMHNVPVKEADGWVSRHEHTYSTFHNWSKEMAAIGTAQGYVHTPWKSRVRWANESNTKGSTATALIAVNAMIQGTGSDITKQSKINIRRHVKKHKLPIHMLISVYDEIVVMVPGECQLDFEASKIDEATGLIVKPKWKTTQEAKELIELCRKIMEDTETECFQGILKGAAEASIAPYWDK